MLYIMLKTLVFRKYKIEAKHVYMRYDQSSELS